MHIDDNSKSQAISKAEYLKLKDKLLKEAQEINYPKELIDKLKTNNEWDKLSKETQEELEKMGEKVATATDKWDKIADLHQKDHWVHRKPLFEWLKENYYPPKLKEK